MNAVMKKISLLGLSAAVLVSSVFSVEAMPLVSAPVVKSDVEQVQYWRDGPPPRWGRDGYYRDRYYGGRHDYRPRHRSHGDAWVPLAAFAAGALIGGAVASQPRYAPPARRYVAPAGVNPRHYQYCAARYRSYDAYSNTFQPYNGPRQPCYSPYY